MFCHLVNCLVCDLAGESFLKQESRAGMDVRGAFRDQPGGEKRFGRPEEALI